jgi:hypothetical protein
MLRARYQHFPKTAADDVRSAMSKLENHIAKAPQAPLSSGKQKKAYNLGIPATELVSLTLTEYIGWAGI